MKRQKYSFDQNSYLLFFSTYIVPYTNLHGSWIVFFKGVSDIGTLMTIVDSIELSLEFFISIPLLASTSSVTILLFDSILMDSLLVT